MKLQEKAAKEEEEDLFLVKARLKKENENLSHVQVEEKL